MAYTIKRPYIIATKGKDIINTFDGYIFNTELDNLVTLEISSYYFSKLDYIDGVLDIMRNITGSLWLDYYEDEFIDKPDLEKIIPLLNDYKQNTKDIGLNKVIDNIINLMKIAIENDGCLYTCF